MFGFNYPGIVGSDHIYINIFLINMLIYNIFLFKLSIEVLQYLLLQLSDFFLQQLEIWDESHHGYLHGQWSALRLGVGDLGDLLLASLVLVGGGVLRDLSLGSKTQRCTLQVTTVKSKFNFCPETWTWWFTFIKYSFEESGDIFKTSIKSDLWQHVLDRGALNISGTGRV